VTVIGPAVRVPVAVPVAVSVIWNDSVFVRSSLAVVIVVWLEVELELVSDVFENAPVILALLGALKVGVKVIPVGIPLTVSRMVVPLVTAVPSVEDSTEVLQQVAHPSVTTNDAVEAGLLPFVKNKSEPPLVPPATAPTAREPMPGASAVTIGNVVGDA